MSSIPKLISSFYVLLIALSSALSALVYFSGNSILTTTAMLVDIDLPLRDNLSKLRFAIFAQKPILYEYYANTDRVAFEKKFSVNKNVIKAGLYSIPRDEQSQGFLTQIEAQTGQIVHLAEKLDKTLSNPDIDWDSARDILVEVSATEAKVTPLIDNFVALNQKHVTDISDIAKSRIKLIMFTVIGFSVLILIFAVLLGNKVKASLAKS